MTRRGFTLLEVALAAAIGGLIVLAALGLLTAMDRTDRRLQARVEQQSELERVHLVMDRALGAILVSDQAPPSQQVSEGQVTGGQERGAPLPPRIQLSMDRGMGQMARRPDASGEVNVTTPQRLEIVLLQSPVPTDEQSGSIDRWIRASRRIGDREREEEEEEESATPVAVAVPVAAETDSGVGAEAAVKAVRGAFEWRQKPAAGSARGGFAGVERTEDGRTVWELWWIPLPRLTDDGRPVESLENARPYRIASDIVYGRWLAFSKRERKPVYATAYRLELPAYFEMEVETVNGQYANWMFEVGWATGPETFRTPAPAAEGDGEQPTREDLDRARARARVTPGARPGAGSGDRPAGNESGGAKDGGK